jgi:hypothetical protein
MKRQIQGLGRTALSDVDVPDGIYLVRTQRAHYRWHKHKPFYSLQFYVLRPAAFLAGSISARLYCGSKGLWKLGWFLRDFGYNQDLLDRDEIDEQALIGLQGIIRISHQVLSGRSVLNLDAFAPAADWDHLASAEERSPEVA